MSGARHAVLKWRGRRVAGPGIGSRRNSEAEFGHPGRAERNEMASVMRLPTRLAAFALIAATCFLLGVRAMAADGLITIKSAFGPEATMKRLEAEVKARGLTVFARVDHAAGAAAVNLPLRPTDFLIFGNAKGGTPLMQSVQTIGIDLPLKVLVWQDESGTTWLSYNDPAFLAHRHRPGEQAKAAGAAITAALNAIATKATTPP